MELLTNDEVKLVFLEDEDYLVEEILLEGEQLYLPDDADKITEILEEVYNTDGILLTYKEELEDVEHLLYLINRINNDSTVKTELVPNYSYDENFEMEDKDLPKIKVVEKCYISEKVQELAYTYLICNSGRPNYDNISELMKHGIVVEPGETDSFGWLSGMIPTKKGYIIFG